MHARPVDDAAAELRDPTFAIPCFVGALAVGFRGLFAALLRSRLDEPRDLENSALWLRRLARANQAS